MPKARALLAIIGDKLGPGRSDKEPAEAEDDAAPESAEGESTEARDYAREAFDALKADDKDGFVEAMLGLHACSQESPLEEE